VWVAECERGWFMHHDEFTIADLQAAREELARIEREIFRNLSEDTKTRFAEAYDRVMKIRRCVKGSEQVLPSRIA